ncbi:hypothetical protein CC1G_08198 [Coprinopsis cinerea okayama7|uniref:Uncharacterized protein n=1 Tax=Coprinopsis cinerea (strain Okayama-7 / 130 / ATCC MYA-4618 / FGSC 9003) TaxID=240176 RepID=A8P7C5_COPC7|nr:hypothetical protein CC1G_08198 [Coprinopsis cinerea okayama7\|eukprot:XP_001839331.2 hypothetical protein CC1G_08198 [Coprinopsis cinerea okayama7\
MGNTSSIFYPDNPKRLNRAQQLADDCKYAKDQYESAHARLERELGPYKEKLDNVLRAFGCNTIADFDRLVRQNATGAALDRWNATRQAYDDSLIVDQIIMVAEGVVAIAGFIISAVGALAGGIGFFAGLGITADILLVLGLIGAIYDIINGAVQREKLRDAINELVPTRLKAKYAQMHMEQLLVSLPGIKELYEAFESVGYDKDKILEKIKHGGYMDTTKEVVDKLTYVAAGNLLASMDHARGAWTNEDPDWYSIARALDYSGTFAMAVEKTATVVPQATEDRYLQVRFPADSDSAALAEKSFRVELIDLEGEDSARVCLKTEGNRLLISKPDAQVADLATVDTDGSDLAQWIVSLEKPNNTLTLESLGDLTPAEVYIKAAHSNMFLTKGGTLQQQPVPVLANLFV